MQPDKNLSQSSSVVKVPSEHFLYLHELVVEFHVHLLDTSVVLADSQTVLLLYVEQAPNVTQPAPLVVQVVSLL